MRRHAMYDTFCKFHFLEGGNQLGNQINQGGDAVQITAIASSCYSRISGPYSYHHHHHHHHNNEGAGRHCLDTSRFQLSFLTTSQLSTKKTGMHSGHTCHWIDGIARAVPLMSWRGISEDGVCVQICGGRGRVDPETRVLM